jgi:Acetyl-coenzyme A synthetase N-terminus
MSDKAYDVPAEWAKRAWVNAAKYEEMYKRSVTDPEGFWAEHGKRIDWFKPFSKVKNTSFDTHNVSIKWFEDGVTTSLTIVSIGICPSARTRRRSSGKATIPRSPPISPMLSSRVASDFSPMC